MRMTSTVALLILVLVIASTGGARAADMCFYDGVDVLVAKSFSIPAAGKCKAVNAYQIGKSCIMSGSACGTTDNQFIAFNLNFSCGESLGRLFGVYGFVLSRQMPDQATAGWDCQTFPGAGGVEQQNCPTFAIVKIVCPTSRPFVE